MLKIFSLLVAMASAFFQTIFRRTRETTGQPLTSAHAGLQPKITTETACHCCCTKLHCSILHYLSVYTCRFQQAFVATGQAVFGSNFAYFMLTLESPWFQSDAWLSGLLPSLRLSLSLSVRDIELGWKLQYR